MVKRSWLEENQIIVSAIIVVAFVWYGASSGLFANMLSFNVVGGDTINNIPIDHPASAAQYNVSLSVIPSTICVGNSTVGSISSNMPNGRCSIYWNTGTGFKHLVNVNLSSTGAFSTTQTINTAGTAIFRAICCDPQFNCRLSNDATLVVNTCNQPDGDDQNPNEGIACSGAIVPAGIGDAGGYCESLAACPNLAGAPQNCDNYWDNVNMQHKCGCTLTYFCQTNFVYALNPGFSNCTCPPGSHLVLGSETPLDNVPDGSFECTTYIN